MTTPLDRQATCPNCGAPLTFRFAGAKAIVCEHCRFLVARTDQNLVAVGKVADLVDIPSPLRVGATGLWDGQQFVVEGRLQLDRAGAPGAPWQETLVHFPLNGKSVWVAAAQGRWYAMSEVDPPGSGVPHFNSLNPGRQFELGSYGSFVVVEVGERRVVSAQGELPRLPTPGEATRFCDFSGPNGAFGTIDYGDSRKIPSCIYLGKQIDPEVMHLDAGEPVEAAEAKVTSLACPNCGGSLPIATPGTTERVVCQYCGMASDLNQGALVALKPAPKPPVEPAIPLGTEGTLRGAHVICIGFVVRGCTVEGEHYSWREYLLYAGPRQGYLWLMEEDGSWKHVTPIAAGDVRISGSTATYDTDYEFKQRVQAQVEFVVGEFYWRVEIGESVEATEYESRSGIVSVEGGAKEVTYSFCSPIGASELETAFGVKLPSGGGLFGGGGGSGGPSGGDGSASSKGCMAGCVPIAVFMAILLLIVILIAASGDGCSSGGSGSGSYGGPSFGGK